MGKRKLVDHLEHGLRIKCADGAVIECAPMMLGDAKYYLEQWDRLDSPDINDRVDARIQIARRFMDRYPQLIPHIGLADVEILLPSFIWRTTGASVVPANGHGSTGTPSGPTISPAGANVPH
jgi:hypothetical protein